MYYLNNFFIFSILGHILESIIYLVLDSHKNSGFLYLPYTPVYGVGIIIIILVNKYIDKLKLSFVKKMVISFFTYTILLTLIEFLGGIIIEKLFHKVLWNYSNHKYNLGKYISIPISLAWGVSSLIYLLILKKLVDKIISKIPLELTILLTVIFFLDLTITIINT